MESQSADSFLTEYLEGQYEPSRWRGRNRLEENLFVWRFLLTGQELPGWEVRQVRTIAIAGTPPLTRSLWSGDDGTTASADIYECPSRLAAHDQVVGILGTIESTGIQRDEGALGDVAFTSSARTVVLFARANLVVFLRNANPPVADLYEAASALDRQLVERPALGGSVVPDFRRLTLRDDRDYVFVGESVSLEVTAEDPLDRPLRYSIWSRNGEVRLEDAGLVYRAFAEGAEVVTAYAVNETAGVASAQLSVSVRGRE